jgi:hypothetical protein
MVATLAIREIKNENGNEIVAMESYSTSVGRNKRSIVILQLGS